jgi:hypothetical protein
METGITIDGCWTIAVELYAVLETVVVVVAIIAAAVVVVVMLFIAAAVVVVVLLLTTPIPIVILPEPIEACIVLVV